MRFANYLTKSRHGIWYYRWVVPARIRAAHPALPKELKRSTRTADIRKARIRARQFHESLALPYMNDDELSQLLEDSKRTFRVVVDPTTGRVEIDAEPHEADAALDTAQRLREMMQEQIQTRMAEIKAARSSEDRGSSRSPAPLMSAAFEKYAKAQIDASLWSDNTRRYTHEPSIALFRELVGESQENDAGATPLDLPLSKLDRQKMSDFIENFRAFPARQGKRYANARDALAAGGEPQSLENYFKRLEHIHQFVRYCTDKGWVNEEVSAELQHTLKRNNKRSRQAEAKKRIVQGGTADDGYVAFSSADLASIFGPGFVSHVTARRSAAWRTDDVARATYRYWTPIIALYTGMRLSEVCQLQVGDLVAREGIPCLSVAAGRTDEDLGATTRIKTISSLRTIPIHPKLIELGLLAFVEQRRQAQKHWLWDGLLWSEKEGFGKYPGRDFNKLTESVGVYVKRRKVFHSFRSTLQQALSRVPLEGTLIDQLIGHEVDSVRMQSYNRTDEGRAFPIRHVHEALGKVSFNIQPPSLRDLIRS